MDQSALIYIVTSCRHPFSHRICISLQPHRMPLSSSTLAQCPDAIPMLPPFTTARAICSGTLCISLACSAPAAAVSLPRHRRCYDLAGIRLQRIAAALSVPSPPLWLSLLQQRTSAAALPFPTPSALLGLILHQSTAPAATSCRPLRHHCGRSGSVCIDLRRAPTAALSFAIATSLAHSALIYSGHQLPPSPSPSPPVWLSLH